MERFFPVNQLSLIIYVINCQHIHTETSFFSPEPIVFPGVNRDVYFKEGDINIGAIMILTTGVTDLGCSKNMYPDSWDIEYPEAIAFATEVVNNDTNLLPNVTLGFFILDDCTDTKMSLAQALTFLPRDESTCAANECSGTSAKNNSYPLSSKYRIQAIPHYDVMGILAPILSTSAVAVSYLLSGAKVPIVGYTTTSDEFSDRTLHPYFLRVVTSDKYQVIAMLEFISSKNWTYISVVYSQGVYGDRAFENIKIYSRTYGICIASSQRVGMDDVMDPVAEELMKYPLARVVILFADEKPVRSLLTSIEKINATGQFIFICCDSVTNASKEKLRPHLRSIIGAFMFIYSTSIVPEFYDYVRRQNVSSSANPWFKKAWEYTIECSFEAGTCDPETDITKVKRFGRLPAPSLAMDAVLTFAHGAHKLRSDRCPDARGETLRQCIKRDELLDYLHSVSFKGYTGTIKFDTNYEFQGTYFINQMAYDYAEVSSTSENETESNTTNVKDLVQKLVARYEASTRTLHYTNETIFWDHLLPRERIVPFAPGAPNSDVPESVCSRPCASDEYKIKKELDCCWDCRRCRDNEILVYNGQSQTTECKTCEAFTWPDPENNYRSCREIPLTYIQPSDTLGVIFILLAVTAILGTCLVIASYIYYHQTRVMKAASRELSFLQLGGVIVGYITVICFQTTPTSSMCSVLYFMFCLSFAWLYSPLLVKAVRIYRIFQSGSKNNQRPRFISPRSQVVLSFLIIISQVNLKTELLSPAFRLKRIHLVAHSG